MSSWAQDDAIQEEMEEHHNAVKWAVEHTGENDLSGRLIQVPRRVLEEYKDEPWAAAALAKMEKARQVAPPAGIGPPGERGAMERPLRAEVEAQEPTGVQPVPGMEAAPAEPQTQRKDVTQRLVEEAAGVSARVRPVTQEEISHSGGLLGAIHQWGVEANKLAENVGKLKTAKPLTKTEQRLLDALPDKHEGMIFWSKQLTYGGFENLPRAGMSDITFRKTLASLMAKGKVRFFSYMDAGSKMLAFEKVQPPAPRGPKAAVVAQELAPSEPPAALPRTGEPQKGVKPAAEPTVTQPSAMGGTAGRMGSPAGPIASAEIDTGRLKVSVELKGKPISARAILDYVRRSFPVPLRGKATHKMRITSGWFDPKAVGIRLRDVRAMGTAIHELGHYLDWHTNQRWSLRPPSAEIGKELVELGKALYGTRKPRGGYKSEGWAEFMREYVTGEEAQAKAPHLFKFFTEKYLLDNPDTARKIAAVKQMVADFRFQGAEARIESQINRAAIKGPVGERVRTALQWANTIFRDEMAPLKRAVKATSRELKPSEDPYELAVAFADKAGSKARQFVLDGTTDLAGNRKGPGLRETVRGIPRREFKAFTRWLYAKEALLRWGQGKNPGISRTDAQYVYDKYRSAQWELAADDVTQWNREVLDYLVEAGGFDPKVRDLLANQPIYIPLFRAFAKGEKRSGGLGTGRGVAQPGKPIKRMKGSGREIVDPFESMIQQSERFISVAHKAMVAKALARMADVPGMAGWIWKVPAPQEAVKFSAERIKKDIRRIAVERLGLDPAEIPTDLDEPWDDVITIWMNASQYYGKDNIVGLFVNGERKWFEVDPDLYRAIEGLDQYMLPWYLSLFGKATRAVRLGATGLNASFGLIRNFVRDAGTMLVTSEHRRSGPVASVTGVAADVWGTEAARHYKALGGKMSAQILNDRIATQRLRDELTGNWAITTVKHPVEALRELFGITELGPRIAEFKAALKVGEERYGKGTLDASIFALNAAQHVTTNFTRHGGLAKILNQLIPFFNASIQGPDKIVRTFLRHPYRSFAISLAGLTLPAVVLWWLAKNDDDWYDHLSDVEKANYIHFRIPGTDKIVRLPVPFELGFFFQTIPIAVLDEMWRKDKGQTLDIFKIAAKRSNPVDWPAAVGPALDVRMNESWTGMPIVSDTMKSKLPEDRYRPYTTSLMRYLGKKFGVAPVQLEYLVDAYTGGLYGRAWRTADLVAGAGGEKEMADIPVVGTLFPRGLERPAEKLDDFYQRLDKLTQKAGSKKITLDERLERSQLLKLSRWLAEQRKLLEVPETTATDKEQVYDEMENRLDRVLALQGRKATDTELGQMRRDNTYQGRTGLDKEYRYRVKGEPAKGQEELVRQIDAELARRRTEKGKEQ